LFLKVPFISVSHFLSSRIVVGINHDWSCRWTKLIVAETSAVTCYVCGVTLCCVFVDLSVCCWLSIACREVMCEGVGELVVTCGWLGIDGSVVIQAIKILFLVTKIIHTHVIIHVISYWFCVPCWRRTFCTCSMNISSWCLEMPLQLHLTVVLVRENFDSVSAKQCDLINLKYLLLYS